MCFLEISQPPPAPLYIWSLVSVFTRNWTPTSVRHRPNPFLLTVPPCLPSPVERDFHPRPLALFLITRTTLPRLPPTPVKDFLVPLGAPWRLNCRRFSMGTHSVGHSQRENSLGESLFIFAVARDTRGKIVQLYLVHSSRPSAFPPLHPLPLHLTSTVSLLRLSVSHTSWNVSFFSLYSRLPLCRFFLLLYFVKFTVLHGTRRIRSFNSVNFPSGNLYYIRVLNNYLTRNSAVFCILFAYKDFCENSRVYRCYFLIAIYK